MLFNSYGFIVLFLPLTLAGYYLLGGLRWRRAPLIWLTLASVLFYAWWRIDYVFILVSSVLFNFAAGLAISSAVAARRRAASAFLATAGVGGNLLLLGYFKYAGFAVTTANQVLDASFAVPAILLPLAISFFTFQQITYLVDVYRDGRVERDFLSYSLFVSFFPQLIAGPIVHHQEVLPQFAADSRRTLNQTDLAVGLTIFTIGLFKKVVLADTVAVRATSVFDAAAADVTLTFFEAWGGALAYSFQIYFDFSGYSDMAIGLGRMFGIRLPLNFASPYRAASIIEFWRCWHMTLSRFLRDHLYVPLGGNRKGPTRRYVNLAITMLLGGLWHGAGWTFIVWGGLHGVFLMINQAWRTLRRGFGRRQVQTSIAGRFAGRILTFVSVSLAWVFFRAESLETAIAMVTSMAGLNGLPLPRAVAVIAGPHRHLLESVGVNFDGMFVNMVFGNEASGVAMLGALLAIVWFMPNTQSVMRNFEPAFAYRPEFAEAMPALSLAWTWRPTLLWSAVAGIGLAVAFLNLSTVSEFIYFNF